MDDEIQQLALATKLSQVYYYRFELVDGDIANANATFVNIWESLGYATPPPITTFGAALGMVVLPEDQPRAARDVHAALAGETPIFQSEYRIRHADGSIHWNLARGIVRRDAAGKPTELLGTSVDVTDLKRVQEDARNHEQRLELAIVGSKTAVWDIELDPMDLLASKARLTNVAQILGYDTDFPPTWGASMFAFHPEDRDGLLASCRELFAGDRREWEREIRMLHRDGAVMWFLMRGVVTRDDAGTARRFTGVSIEITDYKAVAEELQVAKDRLELGLRSSGLGLFDIRLEGPSTSERRSLINVWEPLGYEPKGGDVAGEELLYPEDRPALQAHLQAYLAGEIPAYEIEHRHRHRNGSTRWKLARGLAIEGSDGAPERLIGCLVDITERKEMENRLRQAEERFRRMFENAGVGMGITDADGAFIECNEKLCEFFGYPHGEAMRLAWSDRTVEDIDAERAHLDAVVNGKLESFTRDKRYVRKDGRVVWGHLTASAIVRDETGRATELLGVVQDIDERKRLEEEVQAAREAAEAANRAKDQFLAHVSHEIRTPLNAILGMTELALDATGAHQRELLQTARSAAGNLVEILNELLDFSKIEAGKLELHATDFALRALLDEVIRGLTPRATLKSIGLHRDIDEDVPDVLHGDEGRLRQILVNLLGNAIKFTPKGEARIAVRVVDLAKGHVILAFEVRDTGIGIAKDRQEAIFRAFEQGDASTTRRFGGTGLGLTISAQLADLMGGSISVASDVGRGSTFELAVPFALGDPRAIPERRAKAAPSVDSAAPRRVLVAEDNELNVAVVREILGQRGCTAHYVGDGRAALEAVARLEPDLLLLDLHMPELDGFEVVRAIRARERDTGRHLPIIALTARSAQKDRDEALAAGMDAFLAKPIDVSGLWDAIDQVLAVYPPAAWPVPLLDREVILRVSGGRPEALARLIDAFRGALPGQLARGKTAFEERDFDRLRDAAHRLHGTLGAFSKIAGAAALDLEDASTRGETGRCRELLAELDRMSAELLETTHTLSAEDLDRP